MRLALVFAVLVALVVVLYLALTSGPVDPNLEPQSAPGPASSHASDGPERVASELLGTEGAPRGLEPGGSAARAPERQAAVEGGARIALFVTGDSPSLDRRAVRVECRDALARELRLDDGADGARRAAGIAPGKYTVAIEADGHVDVVTRIEVTAAVAEQRFDFRLERAALLRVRWESDDGRPILDALAELGDVVRTPLTAVVALDAEPRDELGAGTPRWRQTWAVRGSSAWAGATPDAAAEITRATGGPAFVHGVIGGTLVASTAAQPGDEEVVLRTSLELVRRLRGRIEFCLVDENGAPLADALMSARARHGPEVAPIRVGPEGCRIETRLLAGSWTLFFSAPGRGTVAREVPLGPGASIDLGRIELGPPCSVRVRVTDAGGRPVAGAPVALSSRERFESVRPIEWTDAEGAVAFDGLADEEYVVGLIDPRWAAASRAGRAVRPPERALVDLRAVPGTEVALDFGPGAATVRAAFVHDSGGEPLAQLDVPLSGLVSLRLGPGDYVVEVEGASDARAFTVTDESVVFDVR